MMDRESDEDILVRVMAPDGGKGGYANLFGNKTQGLPYHTMVLAIATLVENRLPGAAMAAGDIDATAALMACRELEKIFGESFSEPVLLSEGRVRARASDRLPVSAVDDFVADYRPYNASTAALMTEMLDVLRDQPMGRLKSGLENATIVAEVSVLPHEARVFLQMLILKARQRRNGAKG